MKKNLLLSIFISSFLMLLLVSSASANPNDRGDHGGQPGMPGMPPRDQPTRGDHGMTGGSEYMEISGSVIVGDGVTISLSITPTAEVARQMGSQMDEEHPLPDSVSNSFNVTLYELVEYEDIDADGYDVNDTIVSTYVLNSTTLGEVAETIEGNITTYTVSSLDGVFTLIVDVNVTDNVPHDWKWSLLIEYPFQSTTSDLALVHELASSRMPRFDPDSGDHHRARPGDMNFNPENQHRYNNNSMVAQNEHIPIVFSWDTTVKVDGQLTNVTATSFGDSFALSIPQGTLIDYDPRLSMDSNAIDALDQQYYSIFEESLPDFVNSPSLLGIGLGLGLTILAVLIYRRK